MPDGRTDSGSRKADALGGTGLREGPPALHVRAPGVAGRHDRGAVTQGPHQRRGGDSRHGRAEPEVVTEAVGRHQVRVHCRLRRDPLQDRAHCIRLQTFSRRSGVASSALRIERELVRPEGCEQRILLTEMRAGTDRASRNARTDRSFIPDVRGTPLAPLLQRLLADVPGALEVPRP